LVTITISICGCVCVLIFNQKTGIKLS
jgi:hypothetical protein